MSRVSSEAIILDEEPVSAEEAVPVKIADTTYSRIFAIMDETNGAKRVLKLAKETPEAERSIALEAELGETIKSAYVLPLLEAGTTAGRAYIVTPFAERGTLREFEVDDNDSASFVISVVSNVARGLADIHKAGYVHRDVKPGNIFLTSKRGLIGDLGSAAFSRGYLKERKITMQPGHAVGTLGCMSPEQYLGYPVTEASDVFGLGVSALYTLMQGYPWRNFRSPGNSADESDTRSAFEAALSGNFMRTLPSNLSIEVRDALYGCLEPEAEDRPSVEHLIDLA